MGGRKWYIRELTIRDSFVHSIKVRRRSAASSPSISPPFFYIIFIRHRYIFVTYCVSRQLILDDTSRIVNEFKHAAQPTKENLVKFLEETNTIDLTPDPNLSREELRRYYEVKGRIAKEKIKRLDLYINTLEYLDKSWLELIQKTTLPVQRKEEEAKYAQMVEDETGILKLIKRGKEAKITLEMYMDDFQLAVQQLSEVKAEESVSHGEVSRTVRAAVNLSQLPLTTFSGDPKLWSRFSAAVHLQDIPDIQKLNYLVSCIKGDALLTVRGCDIVPENYDVIRNALTGKFGQPTIIKKSLYNELQSIKRNDREWKTTIEATERVLRQLEAT
ncbi:unnamed protein product, partial [Onchocerca ochengi]|uniref:Uncharacterized protein n=1 Tax=Onchocerca ochengi TaxID=42157 RepID=A0A182ESQ6_ONCOC